jgi:hypothetical protein
MALTSNVLPRRALLDEGDGATLYLKSYLLIRATVGVIGILLPIVLIIGENFFNGSVHARGSVSAYYHSPMRDVFVGAGAVTGVLLLTYLAGQWRTVDYIFSTIAGIAILGVVAMPTNRPSLPKGAARCGPDTLPEPAGCTSVQSTFGEQRVAVIHGICAAIFIASLFVICLEFGRREAKRRNEPGWAKFHYAAAGVMAAAAAWLIIGNVAHIDIFGLEPLYVCEVLSVWAFGASWFAKGDALRVLFRWRPAP